MPLFLYINLVGQFTWRKIWNMSPDLAWLSLCARSQEPRTVVHFFLYISNQGLLYTEGKGWSQISSCHPTVCLVVSETNKKCLCPNSQFFSGLTAPQVVEPLPLYREFPASTLKLECSWHAIFKRVKTLKNLAFWKLRCKLMFGNTHLLGKQIDGPLSQPR